MNAERLINKLKEIETELELVDIVLRAAKTHLGYDVNAVDHAADHVSRAVRNVKEANIQLKKLK
jgi:hypothetical protein